MYEILKLNQNFKCKQKVSKMIIIKATSTFNAQIYLQPDFVLLLQEYYSIPKLIPLILDFGIHFEIQNQMKLIKFIVLFA